MTPIRGLQTALVTEALLSNFPAIAGPNDMTGVIHGAATTAAGFLFALDAGLPANCTNAFQGWLLVSESNKSMTAFALLAWQNQLRITVHAAGIDTATGYCKIESPSSKRAKHAHGRSSPAS